MKKILFSAFFLFVIFSLCITAFAAETVYVDGTLAAGGDGLTAETAFTSFADAVAAVDEGGTVIVCGNTATSTKTSVTATKAMTITSQNSAVLTLGRNFYCGGDTVIENIAIKNGAPTNSDLIYASGYNLTIGEGVTCTANSSTGRYTILAAGLYEGDCDANCIITVNSGKWRNIFTGNYYGNFKGEATVVVNGGELFYADTNNGCIKVGNIGTNGSTNTADVKVIVNGGTIPKITNGNNFTGTYTVTLTGGEISASTLNTTIDLTNGGSVTLGSCSGVLSTKVADGYEISVTNGVYTAVEIPTEPAPTKVYVDGTLPESGDGLTAETAVKTLFEAATLLRDGGTIVVAGDTDNFSSTTLPARPAIVITGVDGDNDYTSDAEINFTAALHLGGDTTFRNVVLEYEKLAGGNVYIFAEGHHLTMDEGVTCLNYTGQNWLSLVGGTYETPFEGDTHITVKSGHFRNIYGGNQNADFKGNTYIEMTGGTVHLTISGGNYTGNFEGDTHITFGGEAAFMYGITNPTGFVGGTVGKTSGTVYTFDGDVNITLEGNAGIGAPIYGTSRFAQITHTGDVSITVSDNVYSSQYIYAGGNAAEFNGNTKVTLNGGEIENSIYGGSLSGTMNGNAEIIINGGRHVYNGSATSASNIPDFGTRNVYGGGASDSVLNGNVSVAMTGGILCGDIAGGVASGTKTAAVTGGTIYGCITDITATVDLSGGTSVGIYEDSAIDTLLGGGTLTVLGMTDLDIGTLKGAVDFVIKGVPLPVKYLTVETVAEGAAVNYAAQNSETLISENGVYSIDFEGAHTATSVTVNHNEGCTVTLYVGQSLTSSETVTADSTTGESATYTLTPGLYSAKVAYTSSNYHQKYFYVFGDKAEETVDVIFEKADGTGYERKDTKRHNDTLLEMYYDSSDIEGFFVSDIPYFEERTGSNTFTTAEECNAYIKEKDEACDYMYSFVMGQTKYNSLDFPVVVFTKDEIPEGATLEEIAAIVGQTAGRDIIQISCGIHGNEPSAMDGGLTFISELCGEYGESILGETNIGAIVILPMMSPEGSYAHTRNTKDDEYNANPNRAYFSIQATGTSSYAYVSRLFLPTTTIDMHEMTGRPNYAESGILTDMYDVGINFLTPIHNSAQVDTAAALAGDRSALTDISGENILYDAMDILTAQGIRPYYYYKMITPGCAQLYSANYHGAYAFIIEASAVQMGDLLHDRHVYLQLAALKAYMQVIIESDGAMAAAVNAGREATALSAQKYNDRTPIVVAHGRSRSYNYSSPWNNPLVSADGTMIEPNNTVRWYTQDTAARYRTRPTAYVLSADVANLDVILEILDRHGIAYYKAESGTVLSLQQYGGTADTPTLGAKKSVTFEAGAYIIPVDGYMANAICILFEPDNGDVGDDAATTFVQFGLLENADIYRCTESYISAKMGFEGTYTALDIPDDKVVDFATVDGTLYSDVDTEDGMAFVVTSDSEYYSAVLTYTDGTEEKYNFGTMRGDMNGDFALSISDAIMMLKGILNEDLTDLVGDINGDGEVNLADVIRLIRTIVQ